MFKENYYYEKNVCAMVLCVAMMFSFVKHTYAFIEVPGYGVDITLALDAFDKKTVREAEEKIDDSGRMGNPYDTVDFNYIYNGRYDLEDLKSQGYVTIAIEITMQAKEVNDGYQYIFIYDDTTDTTLLAGGRFEIGPDKKQTSYSEFMFYVELELLKIQDNNFVIRYGASGNYDDDWMNKNIEVQIGFSKQFRSYSNVWQLEWDNPEHTQYTCTSLPISK